MGRARLTEWQPRTGKQGREGEEDRREDGERTLTHTSAQPGLEKRNLKTEEDGSYLKRATSESG